MTFRRGMLIRKNAAWPIGQDGALLITSGQTVNISEGATKDYSSIQIDAGGTLNILPSTGAWTKIGCAGTCILNGTIIGRGEYNTSGSTVFSSTDPNGFALSYTKGVATAGDGGASGNATGTHVPGAFGNGGGGGSSVQYPPDATATHGGTGGNFAGYHGTGGNVDLTIITAGVAGGDGTYSAGVGGGGGGGARGFHGLNIYLLVRGAISGTGSIQAHGAAGHNGGNGADADSSGDPGGGGGGGGAGGSGGKILVRAIGGGSWSITTNVAGGAAGIGGSGGAHYDNVTCDKSGCNVTSVTPGGDAGYTASAGNAGSYTFQTT